MISVFKLIPIFVPLMRGIIRAARKDSPGGKRITRDELEDLFFLHTPDIIDDLDSTLNE